MEWIMPKDSVSFGQTGVTFPENILKCCDIGFPWPATATESTFCPQNTKNGKRHSHLFIEYVVFLHCGVQSLDFDGRNWYSSNREMWKGLQGDGIAVSYPNSTTVTAVAVMCYVKSNAYISHPKNWCKETQNHFRESRMKFQIQITHNTGRRKETETKDRGHRKATKMMGRCSQILTLRSAANSLKP